MEEYTAKLDGWAYNDNWNCLFGEIYEDSAGRFDDGEIIRTSAVLTKPEDIKEGAIVITRNSKYLLLEPAE